MASVVTGISLDEKLLKAVDRLAKRRKLSRSALVSLLLEQEVERDADVLAKPIVIDGVRYRPEQTS